jgi:hypothetical protein
MEVAVREHSRARNLSTVINVFAIGYDQVGSGRNKVVQVDHGSTLQRQKSVCFENAITIPGRAYYKSLRIHRLRHTASVVLDRPEVGHHTISPEKRVERLIVSRASTSGNLTDVVQRSRKSDTPAKSTQIFEDPPVPKKWARG